MRKAKGEKVLSCEMPKARYDLPVLKSQRQHKEISVVRKPKARKITSAKSEGKESPVVQNAEGKERPVAHKVKEKDGTPPSSKAEGVVINEKQNDMFLQVN